MNVWIAAAAGVAAGSEASAPNSEEKIWSYLKDKGLADAGAAGLMRRHDPHLRRGGPINFGRK